METLYKNRRLILIPANGLDAANRTLESKGYGPNNFSVELAATLNGEVSHYICDVALTDAMLAEWQSLLPGAKFMNEGDIEVPNRLNSALSKESLVKKEPAQTTK